ncbi:MAG: ABC transporter permease [Blastocatellia bacterium]|nr:ABC transporter permease [Blastocatellia bacterium]
MIRFRPDIKPILTSLGALLIGLLGALVVLRLGGREPFSSLAVVFQGALGGRYELTETLIKTCPLILAGLAVSVAFRAGLFNIGAEGQLLLGAVAAVWVANRLGPQCGGWLVPVVLLAAFGAGGCWAGLAALLKTERNVNEVISTLMLNFIAFWVLSYLVHGPLQEAAKSYPQTEMIPEPLFLSRIFPPTRLHSGFLVALLAAGLCYLLLFLTPFGLRLRLAGQSPGAAQVAGISPRRMTWTALFLSGGLAGLAGGVEVLGVSHRLYEQFSPGYGFMSIAVALLAQLHPLAVVPAALFFGVLEVGAGALQRAAGVSASLAGVIEAIVIFGVVVGSSARVGQILERVGRKLRKQN